MPVYKVQAPNGRILEIEGPDNATDAQLVKVAEDHFRSVPKRAADQVAGDAITKGAENFADELPWYQKLAAGFQSGVRTPLRGIGQRAREGIEAVSGKTSFADTLGLPTQQDIDEVKRTETPLMRTGAGVAGNIAGNVATLLPTMAVPGANTIVGAGLIGGATGAMQPTATGESIGQNALLGGAGGVAGQVAGTAIGRVLRPVASKLSPQAGALATAAQARGIPLDAADMTGSRPLTTIRDVLAQMPLTADRQAAIQAAKQEAFNKAVGSTFGAPENALTPQVLSQAKNTIGQQFTDLSARNAANIDNAVLSKLSALVDDANKFQTGDVSRIVGNYADEILSKVDASGKIPGEAYRALDSQIGRTMRGTTNGDIRHSLGRLRDVLREAMDSSINAADQAAWKDARRQYANLMTVAPLAAKSETGDVSGKTLLAAALRGNKSGMFSGGGDLGELGRIGRAFIAEQTPNSGTAQRLFYQRFLENPLNAVWQQGVGGIGLPVQAAINSQAGQRYLTNGMVPISENTRKLVNALSRGTGMALVPAQQE